MHRDTLYKVFVKLSKLTIFRTGRNRRSLQTQIMMAATSSNTEFVAPMLTHFRPNPPSADFTNSGNVR